MQHRPWCLWPLSHHARKLRLRDLKKWAERQLSNLEMFVAQHKVLVRLGVPVLMLSFSELLWSPTRYIDRYKNFAPCLPSPNPNMDVIMNEHIFPENSLKLQGSVASFGSMNPPAECCNYSHSHCREPPDILYRGLDPQDRTRAAALERYIEQIMA